MEEILENFPKKELAEKIEGIIKHSITAYTYGQYCDVEIRGVGLCAKRIVEEIVKYKNPT